MDATVTGDPIFERLRAEFHGGDDAELWALAARLVAADVVKLDAGLEPAPRHVLLTFARVRRERAGIHPDAHATFALSWGRARGGSWQFVGEHPHVKRHRGSYWATVCLPAGTARLAFVDAVVLWRPHLPWAPPTDTEMGRQSYRFRREPDGRWKFLGARDG
jgi:hypothetical protein